MSNTGKLIIGGQSKVRKQQQQQQQQEQQYIGREFKTVKMSPQASGSLVICSLMVIMLALTMLAPVDCQERLNIESRQKIDGDDLNDTMKYLSNLEQLDKYFSQIARPRFGRSDFKQPQLHQPMALMDRSNLVADGEQARYGSLIELINSRLAQKYRDTNY